VLYLAAGFFGSLAIGFSIIACCTKSQASRSFAIDVTVCCATIFLLTILVLVTNA
jgi:hypothetical protein